MDLICVVCGHEPEEGEYYIKLEKWVKGNNGSRQLKEPVMICARHIGQDVDNAFGVGGYKYRQYITRELK